MDSIRRTALPKHDLQHRLAVLLMAAEHKEPLEIVVQGVLRLADVFRRMTNPLSEAVRKFIACTRRHR